jgi:hypothetical protein
MSSLNDIIAQINTLTGYSIPTSSYVYTTGSVPSGSTVYVIPQQQSVDLSGDTISTTGIYPGAVIKADHVLRIINALNGTANNAIIISGSLHVSGSSTMQTNLDLPFTPDQSVLLSNNGNVSGSGVLDGGSF